MKPTPLPAWLAPGVRTVHRASNGPRTPGVVVRPGATNTMVRLDGDSECVEVPTGLLWPEDAVVAMGEMQRTVKVPPDRRRRFA